MSAKIGDTVVIESEKVAQPARTGTIEEVLKDDPPRFRIRWNDGRTTILAPTAGAAKIQIKPKARKGRS
jgi:Domain of unknown function (DUF1918)